MVHKWSFRAFFLQSTKNYVLLTDPFIQKTNKQTQKTTTLGAVTCVQKFVYPLGQNKEDNSFHRFKNTFAL